MQSFLTPLILTVPQITRNSARPLVIELLAVSDACMWCCRVGLLQVDIKRDATQAAAHVRESHVLLSSGGAIFADINHFHGNHSGVSSSDSSAID
ncbi:hypothetical protein LINGRAHAP2_LOCUS14210 [Linum grandiflorum]